MATLLDNTETENAAMHALMDLVKQNILGLRISDDQEGVEFYCGRITLPLLKQHNSMKTKQ